MPMRKKCFDGADKFKHDLVEVLFVVVKQTKWMTKDYWIRNARVRLDGSKGRPVILFLCGK